MSSINLFSSYVTLMTVVVESLHTNVDIVVYVRRTGSGARCHDDCIDMVYFSRNMTVTAAETLKRANRLLICRHTSGSSGAGLLHNLANAVATVVDALSAESIADSWFVNFQSLSKDHG